MALPSAKESNVAPAIVGTATPGSERRRRRVEIHPCSNCPGNRSPEVTLRTPYVIYVRCPGCGAMWAHDKPGSPTDTGV